MVEHKDFYPCCLLFCCTSDPLELVVRIPVGGYTPGQTINLDVEAKNKSDQDVEYFSAQLLKVSITTTPIRYPFIQLNSINCAMISVAANHLPHLRGQLTSERRNHFDNRRSGRWLPANGERDIQNQSRRPTDPTYRRHNQQHMQSSLLHSSESPISCRTNFLFSILSNDALLSFAGMWFGGMLSQRSDDTNAGHNWFDSNTGHCSAANASE